MTRFRGGNGRGLRWGVILLAAAGLSAELRAQTRPATAAPRAQAPATPAPAVAANPAPATAGPQMLPMLTALPPNSRPGFARVLGNSLADAVDRAMPCVVVIKVRSSMERTIVNPDTGELEVVRPVQQGQGSGSFLTPDGYILTSNHVVDAPNAVLAVQTFDNQTYPGKIIGKDPKTDLAVIKVDPPPGKKFPVLVPFDSEKLRIGEIVIALGAPLGLDRTATFGIVSQKGRSAGQFAYENFVQTDASMNPGTSGGPLVNAEGMFVGVCAMIQTTGEGGGNIGIGFVVPSSMAYGIARNLILYGSDMPKSYIGFVPEQTDASEGFAPAGSASVVKVSKLTPGSPAEKGGLQVDDIIRKVDGHDTPTVQDVKKYMHPHAPGDSIRFDILRDGKALVVTVIAGEKQKE